MKLSPQIRFASLSTACLSTVCSAPTVFAQGDGFVARDESMGFAMLEPGDSFLIMFILLFAAAIILFYLYRLKTNLNFELSRKNDEIREINRKLQDLNNELKHSEQMYRLIFQRSPVGIFRYDKDLVITDLNDRFVEILQSSSEQLLNMDMHTLSDKSVLPALEAALAGENGIYEGAYSTASSDASLYILLNTAPIQHPELGLLGGFGIIEDLSERVETEHNIIRAKESAEQADRMKDSFMANMSHEIRTPLNVIMGYLGIMHTDFDDRLHESERLYFTKINLAGKRLLRTVDQILNLSWLESGSYSLKPVALDLAEYTQALIIEMKPLAEDKGLALTFTRDGTHSIVHVDKYTIGQTVLNLLDNAIKFTDQGSVSLRLENAGNNVILSISDTGVGISDEYLRKLYDAFSQEEDGYSRGYEGLGLGLNLAKRYTDLNNGTIEVDSRKGEGATMTLTFQAWQEETLRLEDKMKVPSKTRRTKEGKPTILIVEDDAESQQFMKLILSREFELYFAGSATEAWEIVHDRPIELILMDISLRGAEDGLSLTRRLKKSKLAGEIPVIAVTAHAYENDRQKSIDAGCDAYMSKPFKLQKLKAVIGEYF